jgi:hypothetical protein
MDGHPKTVESGGSKCNTWVNELARRRESK